MMTSGVLSAIVVCLCISIGPVELRRTSSRHRPLRQFDSQEFSCTLPPQPENGVWTLLKGEGKPGENISLKEALRFDCYEGYKLTSEDQYLVCDRRWNSSEIPRCEKLCPPIHATSTTTVKCLNKGSKVDCHEAVEGTYLYYICAPFYEAPFGRKTPLICSGGKWNSTKPVCQPACGKKMEGEMVPLADKQPVTEDIEYPWISLIYKKEKDEFVNVCGGSLIGEKMVLTAAHCVTNANGDVLPKEEFQVAAGKLYSNYNDTRDAAAQYLEVSHIVIHSKFGKDNNSFLADIAILLTKTPFIFNRSVQPVCFNDVNNIKLQDEKTGVIPLWKYKEKTLSSDEALETLEISYRNKMTCVQDPSQNYTMKDKICVGFHNKNVSVCKDHSGSGLFLKNSEDNRYYIHGIASQVISDESQCDTRANFVYTKVGAYYKFVQNEVSKLNECVLPAHPENGKWIVEIKDKNPGDIIPAGTILRISCNRGFKASSAKLDVECDSPSGLPSCQKMCPDLELGEVIKIVCKNKEGETISCAEATDQTTLSYKCPWGYKIPDGLKSTIQCLNGTWEAPTPECQLVETYKQKEVPPMKVVCYYDSRRYYSGAKPEELNVTLCTHIIYHYAALSFNGNLIRLDSDGKDLYESVVAMKNRNSNLKVLLSVYGLGINQGDEFPSVSEDPVKRARFITSAVSLLVKYRFDGLDIHWRYPSGVDKDKFSTLVREVKDTLKPLGKLLSITVYYLPEYMGYNIFQLNNIVDWVNVKCFEFYDEFEKFTGQNSALYASSIENSFRSSHLNLQACAENWQFQFSDKTKVVPAITFFGRYYTLQNASQHGLHAPVTGTTNNNHTGLVSYAEICQKYANWTKVWDKEQQNPYKYNEDKWVGYDDEKSIRLKAAFLKAKKYAGIGIFSIDGDDVQGRCGPKQALLKQVHAGLNDEQ